MAQRDSGFERISGDRYFTPMWAVEPVANFIADRFQPSKIIDPSAGAGHLLLPFAPKINVAGYDVEPDDSLGMVTGGMIVKCDTLLSPIKAGPSALIIMNPPYGERGKMAERFIRMAIDSKAGLIAALLPVDFDSAKTRAPLFGACPQFDAKITLTSRIRWANVVQGKSSPSSNHAWFIWDSARHRGDYRSYRYA